MDPITAVANLIDSITKLVTVIVAGQPPEVQKQLWEWYVADVARWRKLFRVD